MASSAQPTSSDGPSSTLVGAAAAVGRLVWFERWCFELLAGWGRDPVDPEVAVAFAEQARHRAGHADQWFARLPELREVGASAQVVPAPGIEAFCHGLDAVPADEHRVLHRLVALGRVLLPHQVVVATALRDQARPATDRALARTAELVRRDHVEHWEVVQGLLEPRLRAATTADGDLPAALAARQATVEGALLGGGGIVGAWPGR